MKNMYEKNHNLKTGRGSRTTAEIVAVVGVMAAFAAILSYIEVLIPFSIWIPGVKLGLANIAVVVVLHLYGAREALAVNLIRIIVVGLLFGNAFSMLFSISGAAISYGAMCFAKKTDIFSVIGVSVVGGVGHNIGQIAVAALVVETYSIIYYVPALIIAGIITGIIIGIVGKLILRYIVPFVTAKKQI